MESKDSKNTTLDKIKELSQHPIVKGLINGGLSFIPFLGEAISTSLDVRASQLAERNSRIFAEEVKRLLEKLDTDKLDKQFLESDEFVLLVTRILIASARTYEQEKITLYARILLNSVTVEKSDTDYKEGFINIVDDLSVEHVKILTVAYHKIRNEMEDKNKIIVANEIAELLGLEESRVIAYCEQMARFGLIMDSQLGRVLDYQPGHYTITNYGIQFVEFLIEQP